MVITLAMAFMNALIDKLFVVFVFAALIALIAAAYERNAQKHEREEAALFQAVADAIVEATQRARRVDVDAENEVRLHDSPDDSDLFEFSLKPEPFRLKMGRDILYFKNLRSGGPTLARAKILGFRWHRNRGQMVVLQNEFGGRLSRPVSDLMGINK